MKFKFVAIALLLIMASPIVNALVLKDGSYLAIRGVNGDPWLGFISGNSILSSGSPKIASTFFIKKEGGSDGNIIRSGDYVRIRGTDGDPWLSVPKGGGQVTGQGPGNSSLFVVYKVNSPSGKDIKAKDYIKLRGTDGDPWLHVPNGGGNVTGGSKQNASTFFIADAHDPVNLAKNLKESINIGNTDRIQLGWTKLIPCSKFKFGKLFKPKPRAIFAERRIYAYANINGNQLKNAGEKVIKSCAEAGVAACGLMSIITSPGACVPAFSSAFSACLTDRVPDAIFKKVRLFTESKCMWK